MCGRYVAPDTAAIERGWHIGRTTSNPFRTRYNVLPTTQVPVIRRAADADELERTEARWGLIPNWWSKPKLPTTTINARSEEAAAKPMWRHPYREARCLIPALGWYEWKSMERTDPATGEITTYKQPFYLRIGRDGPVCFAGLMATWTRPGTEPMFSCAILTRAPSESAAQIHDRMPVILPSAAHRQWLDPEITDAGKVVAIIRLTSMGNVRHYPVSARLNSAKTDDDSLIESVTV
jgi:putative SOS response-associated peptidase YedK